MKMWKTLFLSLGLLFVSVTGVHAATVADDVIATGKQYIGTPYQYGAVAGQTSSFDCSSYVQYIFGKHNIMLPRTSQDQYKQGTWISRSNLQIGDLVFFSTGSSGAVDHLGVYIGNGQMLHASSSKGVMISTFAGNSYWEPRYVGAKRVISTTVAQNPTTSTLNSQTYVVKAGDTLWTIANKYGTTIAAVKNLNGLNSDMIYVGQTLVVSKYHSVAAGDTLWLIANKYGTSISAIKDINGLNSDMIYVGQSLKVA